MQYITIIELFYASYTDIRTMQVEPRLILLCMVARIVELVVSGQDFLQFLLSALLIFLILMVGCIRFSMGGGDALAGALICLTLGWYGTCALETGFLISVPFMFKRKGEELPLVPFMTIGYVIWLLLLGKN